MSDLVEDLREWHSTALDAFGARICGEAADRIDALEAAQRWSTAPPTEEGWYWNREMEGGIDRVVEVYPRPGHTYLCYYDSRLEDYIAVVNCPNDQWAGPIPAPQEET